MWIFEHKFCRKDDCLDLCEHALVVPGKYIQQTIPDDFVYSDMLY